MVQKLWKLERGELSLEDAETKGSLQDESAKQEGLTLLQLCESEGKASIAFDKTFVKGYFRTGQALALQGKLKEAEAEHQLALAIVVAQLGEEHPVVA